MSSLVIGFFSTQEGLFFTEDIFFFLLAEFLDF